MRGGAGHRLRSVLVLVLTGSAAVQGAWFADAVWYQIFPERFRNGDPGNDPTPASLTGTWPYFVPAGWRVMPWTSDWYALQPWEAAHGRGFYVSAQLRRYGGDLQGILDRLDYLRDLGVNALYLNPVFASPSLHKYGTVAYHHIDPHFGPDPNGDRRLFATEDPADPATWRWSAADRLFLTLVAELHRRDMRLVIDGVFNHVGLGFWAFERARRGGPNSPTASWFRITRWDDPSTAADEFTYEGWAGVQDLPAFRQEGGGLDPAVEQHLQAVLRRWMDPNGDGDPRDGIDGWRLDVAAEVPLAFWRRFRGWVRALNPEAYLTGEIWWEDYAACRFRDARPWLDGAFDGVMNYRFGDAVFRFFNQPEAIPATTFVRLLTDLHRDYGYDRCLALQNLFDSHDTARLGSAVVNPQYRQDHGANLTANRDYRVRAPHATEKRRWRQMVAFQFLAPGAPVIYYGDEVGMWGADDPDCRKPMLWADLRYAPERAHPFGRPRPVDPVAPDPDLRAFYRRVAGWRRDLPALRRGGFRVLLADDARRLFGFERRDAHGCVVAVFNASDEAREVTWGDLGRTPLRGHVLAGPAPTAGGCVVPARGFVVSAEDGTVRPGGSGKEL